MQYFKKLFFFDNFISVEIRSFCPNNYSSSAIVVLTGRISLLTVLIQGGEERAHCASTKTANENKDEWQQYLTMTGAKNHRALPKQNRPTTACFISNNAIYKLHNIPMDNFGVPGGRHGDGLPAQFCKYLALYLFLAKFIAQDQFDKMDF